VRVLLLGTTGYHPTETRQTSCVLLPELGIALDAGTGLFRVGKLLEADELHIALSHAHLDHVVGLTYFFSLMYDYEQRHKRALRRIVVYGEEAKLTAARECLFSPHLFPAPPPAEMEWRPIEPGCTWQMGGASAECFRLDHPGGSLGFRLSSGGKSIAYVTDTTAKSNAAYVKTIAGVDLLLHECNFPDGFTGLAERTGHSCLSEVARVASLAQVKRLVLTHFDPVAQFPPEQWEKVRAIFPQLEAGEDLQEIVV
jgi:ribonuclease Z